MPQQGKRSVAVVRLPKALQVTKTAAPELTLTPQQLRRAKTAASPKSGNPRGVVGGKNKKGQECRWGVTPGGWCVQAPIRADTVIHVHRDERGRPSGVGTGSPGSGTPSGGIAVKAATAVPKGTLATTAVKVLKDWGPLAVSFTPWGRLARLGKAAYSANKAYKAAKVLQAGSRVAKAAKLLPRFIP
jgi:hypothetical protein